MRSLAPALALLVSSLLLSTSPALAYGEAQGGFPNWAERVMHEWMNRARCDPQVEMQACGASCPEGACYSPVAPVGWNLKLNRAARFHSDEMAKQSYFAHDSACTVVPNIDAIYPASSDGSASSACVGGVKTCSPTCTKWSARVGLFGASASGEIIASSKDPNQAFYQWLFESFNKTACAYDQGPPTNGHRWNLLKGGPSVGFGAGAGGSVGDSGAGTLTERIPSGSHYPRQAASVDVWANWYAAAAPLSALVNVDGVCSPMTLARGSGTNGAYTAKVTGVGSGCHRYFFTFKDANDVEVTYPGTGSLGIGPSGSCADWDTSHPPSGAGCSCAPSCGGNTCGDDGCGGSCGSCTAPDTCIDGACACAPACAGKACGDDGCNGSCGACPPGESCSAGACVGAAASTGPGATAASATSGAASSGTTGSATSGAGAASSGTSGDATTGVGAAGTGAAADTGSGGSGAKGTGGASSPGGACGLPAGESSSAGAFSMLLALLATRRRKAGNRTSRVERS